MHLLVSLPRLMAQRKSQFFKSISVFFVIGTGIILIISQISQIAISINVTNYQFSIKKFPKYNQQVAKLRSLFISVNCSTCFGWYLHPSSGAQNYIYSIWYLSNCNEHSLKITNNFFLLQLDKYQMLQIQFFVPCDGWRYHPKHVEQIAEIKPCHVASCWLYFRIIYDARAPER